jgi:hypothetical protein
MFALSQQGGHHRTVTCVNASGDECRSGDIKAPFWGFL